MINGTNLTKTGDAVWSVEWDLAVIPVEPVPGLNGAEIAEMRPNVSMEVHGDSHRPAGDVYVHGKILEKYRNEYESNCQAVHGFSGTGLFDGYGRLFAILSGTRSLRHFGGRPCANDTDEDSSREFMGSSYAFDWRQVSTECFIAWYNSTLDNASKVYVVEDCLEALHTYIETASLNPRARLRPAFPLLELARNASLAGAPGVQ
jgi:hypothetical protein